jgi:hypothetical protein
LTNPSEEAGTGSNLPVPRLTNRDFELVIRRAAELQARESEERFGGDGISEGEVFRIGRELGLSKENLQRAIAEMSGSVPEEGVLTSMFGPTTVRVSRALRGDAAEVAKVLERYLEEREYLAVLRRFNDRVVFTRASGMVASMGRAASQMFSRSPLLNVTNLEMAVRPFDSEKAFVSLSTSLRSNRTAAATSSLIGGGTGAAVTGAVLGIAIAPPAALVALPILGLSVYLGRNYYDGLVDEVRVQLEALLDRLEHGDLPPPVGGWGSPRLRRPG